MDKGLGGRKFAGLQFSVFREEEEADNGELE
jgi:hypothetical protein